MGTFSPGRRFRSERLHGALGTRQYQLQRRPLEFRIHRCRNGTLGSRHHHERGHAQRFHGTVGPTSHFRVDRSLGTPEHLRIHCTLGTADQFRIDRSLGTKLRKQFLNHRRAIQRRLLGRSITGRTPTASAGASRSVSPHGTECLPEPGTRGGVPHIEDGQALLAAAFARLLSVQARLDKDPRSRSPNSVVAFPAHSPSYSGRVRKELI